MRRRSTMSAALRDAHEGQQDARQQMLVQGPPRGDRRRLREPAHTAGGRVLDELRQELAAARRHGVSSQVQREGQVDMDALRRCAEASERRGTAGKGERAHRHHG